MSHTLDTRALLDTVVSLLREGQTNIPVPVAGVSMTPFLRPGDTVYLNQLTRPPRRGDILLFTRPGGDYILHRVAAVHADGTLDMVGDGQCGLEPLNDPARIHALVTAARHKEKLMQPGHFRWEFYRIFWLAARPVRPWLYRIRKLFPKKQKR